MNFLRIKFPIKWHQFRVKKCKTDSAHSNLGQVQFPQMRADRIMVLVFSVVPSLASLATERQKDFVHLLNLFLELNLFN